MIFNLTGTIKDLKFKEGVSQRTQLSWQRTTVVLSCPFTTQDGSAKESFVAISYGGDVDRAIRAGVYQKGQSVDATFFIEAREGEKDWYNDLRGYTLNDSRQHPTANNLGSGTAGNGGTMVAQQQMQQAQGDPFAGQQQEKMPF